MKTKIKICNERRLEIKTAAQKHKDGAGRRRGEAPQYQVNSGVTLILLVLTCQDIRRQNFKYFV